MYDPYAASEAEKHFFVMLTPYRNWTIFMANFPVSSSFGPNGELLSSTMNLDWILWLIRGASYLIGKAMKRAFNQGYLLLKGLRKVKGEVGFTMLAYNMRRAINIVGTKRLIGSFGAACQSRNVHRRQSPNRFFTQSVQGWVPPGPM